MNWTWRFKCEFVQLNGMPTGPAEIATRQYLMVWSLLKFAILKFLQTLTARHSSLLVMTSSRCSFQCSTAMLHHSTLPPRICSCGRKVQLLCQMYLRHRKNDRPAHLSICMDAINHMVNLMTLLSVILAK